MEENPYKSPEHHDTRSSLRRSDRRFKAALGGAAIGGLALFCVWIALTWDTQDAFSRDTYFGAAYVVGVGVAAGAYFGFVLAS